MEQKHQMCIFIGATGILPVTILEASGRAMAILLFLVTLLSAAMASAQIAGIETKLFDEPVKVQHGSSVLPLKSGAVLLFWFQGSAETGGDNEILCCRKTAGGWQAPWVVVHPQERPVNAILRDAKVANTATVQDEDGVVYLFYSAIPLYGGFANSRVDYKSSLDEGKTWSKPTRLDFSMGAMVRHKPLRVGDHEYLLPMYSELSLFTPGFKQYSYLWHLKLSGGRASKIRRIQIPGLDDIQPSLAFCGTGGRFICAYLRNQNGGLAYFSKLDWSTKEWSPIRLINVPNSDSPMDVVQLGDGRILMVYNNRATRPRSPLSLSVSSDGENFTRLVDLETDPSSDYCYPSICEDAGKRIHISYIYHGRDAIKYVSFRELDLP